MAAVFKALQNVGFVTLLLCSSYWVAFLFSIVGFHHLIFSTNNNQQYQRETETVQHRRRLTSGIISNGFWSDPKTMVGKNNNELTVATTNNNDLESLRIVAFGSSKTWGAGLIDPDNESYIKLLSPTALNLGLRATPADYPSLCLHSMIGDQVFDVIILEFSPFTEHAKDFDRLAKRLRARFPSAIIIYLPIYMLLLDVVYQRKNLQEYLTSEAGLQTPKDAAFAPTVRNLVDADLYFPATSNDVELYRKIVNGISGYMLEFPTIQDNNIKSFVIDNERYYGSEAIPWDSVHPSALGHQAIAQRLWNLLATLQPITTTANTALGSWLGGQDHCVTWFSNGNVTEGVRNFRNMDLVNFMPRKQIGQKWGAEVGRKGGTLSVKCPFSQCNIYLSYMTKGPAKEYPKVQVSVNGQQEPTLIDPLQMGGYHLRQIAYVGTAKRAGWATVSVKPIPDDAHSILRFRITGVIATPTTK